jgi:large subunit ribosomal protein L29
MPIQRMKDLNAMSDEDRAKKLAEFRAELSRLRTMVSAGGAIENPTRIREIRKAIAQVLTVESEKRIARQKTAPKTVKKPLKAAKEKKTPKTPKPTKKAAEEKNVK